MTISLSGALLVYSSLDPRQIAKGQAVPQPSGNPASTCDSWYQDTGSCAYYTFGCDYSVVLSPGPPQTVDSCDVCNNPVETWPTCFKGTRQSPIHLSEAEAVPLLVDPGSVTFTGYEYVLNPSIRTQGYGLIMNLKGEGSSMTEAPINAKRDDKLRKLKGKTQKGKSKIPKRNPKPTVGKEGSTSTEAPISANRKDKYNMWKGTTYKRKLNIPRRTKNKKKGRNKRQFLDWLFASSRQGTDLVPTIPSITGGPLSTNRSVHMLCEGYPRPVIPA